MIQLSQKEKMFLQDLKSQEEICVKKYQIYSAQAQDTELKQLFNTLSTEEQHHFTMVSQMLQGQEPNSSHPQQQTGSAQQQQAGSTQQQQAGSTQQQQAGSTQQSTQWSMGKNTEDKMLCSDLLSTEKYVSGAYDTAVFEAVNTSVRQALQHIQQDEQQHGHMLFTYMQAHGMYNVQ